jgi:phenylacetate-CoA ligase
MIATDHFPLIDDAGRQLLRWLQEHPHAPRYNHFGVDRLSADGLQRVRVFEAALSQASNGWTHDSLPTWLPDFARMCYDTVPFYRRHGALPARFADIPTCARGDLSREPWAFVPDTQPLDGLTVYQTSGTTGHPLDIITHPEPLAMYLPLMRFALATQQVGVRLDATTGRVAIALVCFQQRTFTYAAVSAYLAHAGLVKINLNPDDWRDKEDRAKFLDACNPAIYSGDPLSFAELLQLPLQSRPKALVSTSMALLPAFRQQLAAHFGCPVIDIYAMNEAGPIAVAHDAGHVVLPHRIYIEILDEQGQPCPPDVRGEIALSGGFNPFLPLLRYRTGDYASLTFRGAQPILVGLEGREPVIFRGMRGETINNIDVSTALKRFALPQYQLHQFADGALRLRVHGVDAPIEDIRERLEQLFGEEQELMIEVMGTTTQWPSKIKQFTSDLKS